MKKKDKGIEQTRQMVREHYGHVAETDGLAQGDNACCCSSSCCENDRQAPVDLREMARRLGYGAAELDVVPDGTNMGLGCGNPQAIAMLKKSEVVVDLGAGGGFDVFLAAQKVGPKGRVIGVDMTPEMVSKARRNVEEFRKQTGLDNVEFRLGEIEHLPVADSSVDVVISNCVINLSPEKQQVFNETYRVLRPGGRLAISDVVQTRSFTGTRWEGSEHISACISGSATVQELETMLRKAGFSDVRIALNEASREFIKEWDPGTGIEDYICSALIEARK